MRQAESFININLDLLYYPPIQKLERGTINNLKQFKNIYFIKREKTDTKPVFTANAD